MLEAFNWLQKKKKKEKLDGFYKGLFTYLSHLCQKGLFFVLVFKRLNNEIGSSIGGNYNQFSY